MLCLLLFMHRLACQQGPQEGQKCLALSWSSQCLVHEVVLNESSLISWVLSKEVRQLYINSS